MRRRAVGLSVILSCGLLFAGCAKKEMVKQEETPPPAAAPAEKTPAEKGQEGKGREQQQVPEKPMQEAKVKEEQASSLVKQGAAEVVLETVYFDFDSHQLSPAAREVLAKDAEQLKKSPAVKVQVEGHCDERGSDEYNLALGEKRGNAARDYLVTLGIPADRFSVISYGKEKPADPGHDEAAWARNRRAVLVIQK
jgi:peptidoglycan-associated lipoprotein